MNRAVLGAAALTFVAFGAGFATRMVTEPSSGPTTDVTPRSTTTVEVQTRDLVVEETLDANVVAAGQKAIASLRSGVVTSTLPAGTRVDRGHKIASVNNLDLMLMIGSAPAFRAFTSGMSDGQDVLQLEQNLAALGFDKLSVDTTFDDDTATEIEAWESANGVSQPDGTIDLGQVAFFEDSVLVDTPAVLGQQVAQGATLATVRTVSGQNLRVQFGAGSEQDRYQKGKPVSVATPSGKRVQATIASVDRIVEARQGGGSTNSLTITADVDPSATEISAGPTKVYVATAEAKGALAVPSRALVAVTEGGHAVELASGSPTRYVRVELGVFADGWVQITGQGISAGTKVVMPT